MKENLTAPLASGRTADIFAWHDGQVLKLFHDWFRLEDIQYEQRIAQAVHACGLPVPSVGEIIQVNNQNGLIYQRIVASSMWELMRPWNCLRYARQMAILHVEMHKSTVDVNIPAQRQKLIKKINTARPLPGNLRSEVLRKLEEMPDGDRLCHGDFHPGNLLVSGQDVIIIDWIDATLGNPLADLARTSIISMGANQSNQIQNPWHRIFIRILHNRYIHHYFAFKPGGESEYSRWLPIVAAARLSENISELEKWLIELVKKDFGK